MNVVLFTLLSCLTLFCFIFLGIGKFGLLPSYSDYSTAWNKEFPIPNMNLWSILTFIAAVLILPVLLEISDGHLLQFLGFLTPVYLICVSLTPDWAVKPEVCKWHAIFAWLCALCALLFIVLVLGKWWCVIIALVISLGSGLITKTLKSATTFWAEMIMFIGMYLALIV